MKPIIFAGPCLAENLNLLKETSGHLKSIADKFGLEIIFKSSYKKANRTSINSFTGAGDVKALEWLASIRESTGMKIITDVHTVDEAILAAKYVDYLQIPAFLSRQTELLIAAGETGKPVNIKKGQFMAPKDMEKAASKVSSTGNNDILLTERGTFFGYNDLVVDFRSIVEMKKFGYPVIYDATHSVQRPSIGEQSGGSPEFIFPLVQAAIAAGADGVFFETHPDPKSALSDAATQLPLAKSEKFIQTIVDLYKFING